MSWLYLLLAIAGFAFAMVTTSGALLWISLLAALVFCVLGVMGLLAERVGGQARDESLMLDPAELVRLREQAEARRAANAAAAQRPGDPPTA